MLHIRRRDLFGLAVAPFLTGLQAHQHQCPSLKYERTTFSHGGVTHDVYAAGSGPPVIVIHEITGASSLFFKFTDCLAAEGFRVHCPVLFGTPFAEPGLFRNLLYALKACHAGSDIKCWRPSAFSDVNPWLTALAEEISGSERKPLGAIGMCLSGIQPLAMLRCKAVVAPVLCQPTIPIGDRWRWDLGLPPSDIDFAVARVRAERLPVLAIRYEGDRRCPPERMEKLRDLFHPNIELLRLPGDKHSSMVHDPSPVAFEHVVKFLGHLKTL